jgi:hypothetical protein
MNTQDIINPIGELLTASFEYVIVPLGDFINLGAIALGFIGMVYWLSLQNKLSAKAKREGNIV